MMFCVLPLVPLVWWTIGALVGVGGTVVVTTDWGKPPYEEPKEAYKVFCRSVEKGDYTYYQYSVDNPMPEAEFTMRCDQRKKQNLAEIKEGVGDLALNNKERTEGIAKALSPWDRKERCFQFKKIGDSWKVVDEK